jgi:CHAT domain-containing protein/Tfp pilus assembly protein PilF
MVAFLAGGCHPAPSPESVYADAREKARHGELDPALNEADQAYRKYSKKNTEWAWRFRVLKAHFLVLRGSNDEALALLSEDLPPALANTEVAVRRKMVQGLACDYSQQFASAEKYFSDAQQLADAHVPELLGDVATSRGGLEVHEEKYEEAESDFRQALAIARAQKLPFLEAAALGDLGLVATKREHYDESVDWNRAALEASRSVSAKGSEAKILGNIGWSYFKLGDFENSLIYYKQAEQASTQTGLPGDRIYWLSNIGSVYYEEHDYESAEAALQTALDLARRSGDKETITQCLNNLSEIALERGQFVLAEKYNTEALDLEAAGPDKSGQPDSLLVTGRIESGKGRFARTQQIFRKVIQDPRAETSLRWEAEAQLADASAAQGDMTKADREFRRSVATVETARSSVKTEEFRLSFLSSAIAVYGDYIDFLVGEGKMDEALQVAELSRARTLADGLGFSSSALSFPIRGFQPTRTARTLNSTILSYWLGTKHSYVWVIDAARVRLISLPPTAEIDSLVQSYRQALTGPRDVLETRNVAGQKLFQLLVAPAFGKLKSGSRVIVIPDGSLYGLDFDALLVAAPDLHYWIDDVVVSNANSLVLLGASAAAKSAGPRKLLLVGDPIPSSGDFPKLPQAESEMKQVESYFPGANSMVYANGSATPDAYLSSHPDQFSFIHFVAHGTASLISPLDSAVILTRQGDSYKLYARDIIKQPLRAELVTISACHGAGERTYSGEGLVGLTWAFLRAGAHEVISALWEVDDNSTPQLMNRLYAGLSKGASPETALRDAKLSLVHSGSIYKKPFYWAPFQIYRGL